MASRNHKNDVSALQNDTHRRVLSALLKQEDNRRCADCLARGPTWASVNLGVFVCLNCSGIHRSLGVHNSKVRSTNLDTWLPEQVAFVQVMGNARANSFWEAELPPGFSRPAEADMGPLRSFIMNKYVHRKYAMRGYDEPPTISNYLDHPFMAQYLVPARNAPPPPPASVPTPQQPPQQQQQQQQQAPPAAPQAAVMAPRAASQPAPAPAPAPVDLLDFFDAPAPSVNQQQAPPGSSPEQDLWSIFHGVEAGSPVHVSASAPDICGSSGRRAAGAGATQHLSHAPSAALQSASSGHDPFATLESRASQTWSWGAMEAALPAGGPAPPAQLRAASVSSTASVPVAHAAANGSGAMSGSMRARQQGPKLSHENILALFDTPSVAMPGRSAASASGVPGVPGTGSLQFPAKASTFSTGRGPASEFQL